METSPATSAPTLPMPALPESAPTDWPRISVITAVRDDLEGLRRTHASLAAQRERSFDWIVVDGGSLDGTRDYLLRHHCDLFWWRSQPDGGIFDAMNHGLAKAGGDYLLFLNAGDTLPEPDTFARVLRALAEAGVPDLVYGDTYERAPDGHIHLKPARDRRLVWYGMFTHHQAFFYHRRVVDGLRYDLDYKVGADYAFTIAALRRARSVLRLHIPLAVCAPPGWSALHPAIGRRDQWRIRRNLLALPPFVCNAIALFQNMTWHVRTTFPYLFHKLRFRRPRESQPASVVQTRPKQRAIP
ncbi:MAG TPA: glycosyltransferase family 2 protein [Arenibaculum sp.]|nr:glycosyltransferase family 2 protein [Arenibaculum sp.]